MLKTLQEIKQRMVEIEGINQRYNRDTNFGTKPNGQELQIEALLAEWDNLKVQHIKLKNGVITQ